MKTLLSWNVNGIRAVEKKGFVRWVQIRQPDILCLQETKAGPDQLSEGLRSIPGYACYFAAAEKKGYSGVALYTRENPISVKYECGKKELDSEGRLIISQYPGFFLFNIYFPNGGSGPARLRFKMAFYATFLGVIQSYINKGCNVIVCGDVNTAHKEIDLARPKENEGVSGFLPQERAWIDRLEREGLVDTFRMFHKEGGQYSWWDYKTGARARNVGWRIDYFFVNQSFIPQVKDAFILTDVMGSDHCPVGITIND